MTYREPAVRWRGSVSDVATDLAHLLTASQLRSLARSLEEHAAKKALAPIDDDDDDDDEADAAGPADAARRVL